jgi:hypothetical protein
MKLPTPTRRSTRWLILLGLSFCLTITLIAQTTCDTQARDVLSSVKLICNNSERDFVCYGNILVEAQPQAGSTALDFERPGDHVNVANVKSLQLSPLDFLQGTWGVAQLRLIPTTARRVEDDLVMLFFGDVTVQDQSTPRDTFDFTVTSSYSINLRNFPSLDSTVIGLVEPDATLRALGRLEDGSWLRVQKQPGGTVGWINAEVLEVDNISQLNTLAVEGSSDPYYGPMQAIYFQSGEPDASDCGIPTNGLLIQTPEGVARVTVLINEVTFDFVNTRGGSTAFIQAQPNSNMNVSMLEGAAYIGAGGASTFLPPGAQLNVPMSANLTPNGAPSLPVPNKAGDAGSGLHVALDRVPVEVIWQTVSNVSNSTTNVDTTTTSTTNTTATDGHAAGNTTGTTIISGGGTTSQPVTDLPVTIGGSQPAGGGGSSGGGSTDPSGGGGSSGGGSTDPSGGGGSSGGGSTDPSGGTNKHGCEGQGNSCNAPGKNK